MVKNFKKLLKVNLSKFNEYIDFILLVLVVFCILNDIIIIISLILEKISLFYFYFNNIFSFNDFLLNMVDTNNSTNSNTSSSTYNTNVKIVHDDGTWSNTIKSLFLYGTGLFRLSLIRPNGSGGQRAFVIASTIAVDGLSKIMNNSINDPEYVKTQFKNWKIILRPNGTEAEVTVDKDTFYKIDSVLPPTSKFLNDENGLSELVDKIVNKIISDLKSILEPVEVDYSNELLADQIYHVSILLFILSLIIIGLFICFIVNIVIVINSEKILSYIKNKYIRWYIIFNKKMISIEIFFLSVTILYVLYDITKGLHFIATHPINLN